MERQHNNIGFNRTGEVLATPLQIANLCATVANRGWFDYAAYRKAIQDTVMPEDILARRRHTIDLGTMMR